MTTSSKLKYVHRNVSPAGVPFTEKWDFNPATNLMFVGVGKLGRAVFKVQPDKTLRLDYSTLPEWWKPLTFAQFMKYKRASMSHP